MGRTGRKVGAIPTRQPQYASNRVTLHPARDARRLRGIEGRLGDQAAAAIAIEHASDVTLACQGDAEAFERLYRTHVGAIRGLARRMAGDAAADELTQDAFVRAWEKLHTFRGEAQFGTWLYRLAINVIVERRRWSASRAWLVDDGGVASQSAS